MWFIITTSFVPTDDGGGKKVVEVAEVVIVVRYLEVRLKSYPGRPQLRAQGRYLNIPRVVQYPMITPR